MNDEITILFLCMWSFASHFWKLKNNTLISKKQITSPKLRMFTLSFSENLISKYILKKEK